MTWFKVDDKLHDHRKARRAGKSAMGVWVLAGSWCMDNETDGFVPADVLPRWGTKSDAGRLVSAGFWYVDQREGEDGWRFHDWEKFQPSAATLAGWRAAESEAGQRGNHKRWHADRGVNDPNCPYCYRVPDQAPDQGPEGVPESGGESPPNRVGIARNPNPYPNVSPNGETRVGSHLAAVEPAREDVARLCDHLADRVAANGSKRPAVTKRWHDAARLMLDNDGRTEEQVHAAIDWCQDDEFWRGNVMAMPKLREKFDQMRLQAQRRAGATAKPSRAQGWLQLAADLADKEARP